MVFQQPNPFPMSIFDNVAFGVREHNRRIKRQELEDIVAESLKRANLWEGAFPTTLAFFSTAD